MNVTRHAVAVRENCSRRRAPSTSMRHPIPDANANVDVEEDEVGEETSLTCPCSVAHAPAMGLPRVPEGRRGSHSVQDEAREYYEGYHGRRAEGRGRGAEGSPRESHHLP